MRFFPSASRQRLVAATAVTAMAVGGLAVPLAHADAHFDTHSDTHADDSLKDQQHQVERQVRAAARDLHESSRQLVGSAQALTRSRIELVAAEAALIDVRAQLAAAEVTDADLARELQAAEAALDTARVQLGTGEQAVEAQRLVVAATVTSLYEHGDPGLLALSWFLSSEDPGEVTRRVELGDVMVAREAHAYDDLRAAEVALQVNRDAVAAAEQQVGDRRAEAAAHLTTVEDLHAQALVAEASVRELVGERRSAKESALEARRTDRRDLRGLRAEDAKIKHRILAQARRQAQKQAQKRASRGRITGGFTGETSGFLTRPVVGPVTSPFGYRIHPIYGYWGMHDGTDFGAACGTELAAAADGTVMSQYYSSSYGNRLHLNLGMVNGRNLTVVYNHLSAFASSVGDRVTRGEMIGYVGDTGWSTGCHLHFTVLLDGDPVDPMDWI